jgi:hypothetical protein
MAAGSIVTNDSYDERSGSVAKIGHALNRRYYENAKALRGSKRFIEADSAASGPHRLSEIACSKSVSRLDVSLLPRATVAQLGRNLKSAKAGLAPPRFAPFPCSNAVRYRYPTAAGFLI